MIEEKLATALGHRAGFSDRTAGIALVFLVSIVLAVGAFYVATIRDGHEWGDDFSLYILHAKNIAEGINYQQTGYIYNPTMTRTGSDLVQIGPPTYPPVFPLLLSLTYKVWGLNLKAMKIEIVALFLLALIAVFMAFRNDLPWPRLIALLAIIGFNPYIWRFKDNIVSDLPFLFFIYLGLFLINRVYRADHSAMPRAFDALLISLAIYLAYGARSIGLVLLLCLLTYDFIKHRRLTAFAVKVSALTALLAVIQSVFFHSDSSYSGQLGISLGGALHRAWVYTSEFSAVWAGASHKALRLGLFLAMSAMAIIGYLARIRARVTLFELFPVLYMIPLLILPTPAEIRYLMPIIPIYLFYTFLGVQAFFNNKGRASLVFPAVMVVISIAYTTQYARLDYGPIREGIARNETKQLFDYIRKETSESDVFVFRKPRALALFTGRKASALHHDPDDQALWKYLRQIKTTYLVLGPKRLEPDDQEFLCDFIARNQARLQETFTNADFQVYRIKEY